MLQGSMPALITPFKNGAVDLEGLKALVAWHIAEGSHGLVPVGTTGESPTLSHEEHEAVVSAVVEAAAGRIPIVAGAGSNNTSESLRFMHHAKDVGAGIMQCFEMRDEPLLRRFGGNALLQQAHARGAHRAFQNIA